jgi:hypothetical protein
MRGNLWDDPRVSTLADITGTSEASIVGGLYWLWNTADQHTEDGFLPSLTLKTIDRKTGIAGFGAALVQIGWVTEEEGGIHISRFAEHNGASAKKRAVTAKRVANHRSGNADVTQGALQNDDDGVTGALAREREEKSNTVPKGTGAGAPDPIFGTGLQYLVSCGVPERGARSFLGKMRQAVADDLTVVELLTKAQAQEVSDPLAWLRASAGRRTSTGKTKSGVAL